MYYTRLPVLLTACIAAALFPTLASAQYAVLPVGGDASNPSATASYSVGLPAYQHYHSPALSVQEGVQQPNLYISTLSTSPSLHTLLIFPNPSHDALFLRLSDITPTPLLYRIVDHSGKTLLYDLLNTSSTTHKINIHTLPNGHYQLLIFHPAEKNKIYNSYHFIKH